MRTMKFDKETLSGHSAILSKHNSPQFSYMKTNIDIAEQKIVKNQMGLFTNLQRTEKNATPLALEINDKDEFLLTPELECTMIVEGLSTGTENKIRDSVDSCKIASCNVNWSGKTDLPTTKGIMPCELPEFCYKDDAYVVKDICIDEEVLVKDKIITNKKNDKSGYLNVRSDGNKQSVMMKGSESDEFLSPDGSLQSSENDDGNDSQEMKCLSESAFMCEATSGEANSSPTGKIAVDVSSEEAMMVEPLSSDFSSQKTLMSFLISSDYDGNEFDQLTNKIPYSKVTYGIPVRGLDDGSKLDCMTAASEYNSCKLAFNDCDEAQQAQDESIFSMVGPPSGRIACTGPMLVYSGSVSLRSDSSSTRSFAFPILQPEWQTSPVKMAKPDRRQYRKHAGWKQALLCCRF